MYTYTVCCEFHYQFFFVEVANLFPSFYASQDRPTTKRQNKRMQLKVNGTDKKYRLVRLASSHELLAQLIGIVIQNTVWQSHKTKYIQGVMKG